MGLRWHDEILLRTLQEHSRHSLNNPREALKLLKVGLALEVHHQNREIARQAIQGRILISKILVQVPVWHRPPLHPVKLPNPA